MTKIGEGVLVCSRCQGEHIHALLFRLDSGERLCRPCINDLYNLEALTQRPRPEE